MIVYKYVVPQIGYDFKLELPRNAKIVHFQEQGESLCFWAVIPARSLDIGATEMRSFVILGTGISVKVEDLEYVGTTLVYGGLVWHLFEDRNP